MKLKYSLLLLLLPQLLSCVPSAPYEIRSPCVSTDTDNPYAINPCIRKPVNITHDIG